MTTAAINATLNSDLGNGSFGVTATKGNDVVSAATTADTDVGTVVTDNTTTLAAIDAFAAAVIAITGDTYVAHQFVFGGSTGLTHAQVATEFALINTAITDFLAAQAAGVTAKAATAAVAADLTSDVCLTINTSNVTTLNKLLGVVRAILARAPGLGLY